ncbi:MBL fold metallo-hydrolase [Aestuariibius sp. 2305UL40-4]|uniref:MBL fold metallo-hydrolase n=1 Tax=Aestuariibius violaceus TaxID=3234132 RepID=UPI00345F0DEE
MLTRRQTLATGLAAPALALTPRVTRAAGHEASALPTNRAFQLGEFRVITLLDAHTARDDDPQSIFGMNVSEEEFDRVSQENFISPEAGHFFFTPTLVDTGSERILFDTGLGQGGLITALSDAGYAPADITHVVITHMHPDHVGGLMTDGAATYAEAVHITGQAEFDHWTANPNDAVTNNVLPLQDQFQMIDDGAEVRTGITAVAAFGHTPGHMTYMIESGGQQILLIADLANHYVWSLGYPDWEVRFDMDKEAAAASRRRILDMAATDRFPIIGYHMPFPAAGFVETRGEGFHYVPVSYQFLG